ncbi:MAG: prepilin-type N-terminal cleavage/methylation domain-containing protein, partial [Planctomycetaceae bacterium]|nr:prepilin-type N-terminal cleavage/methylation domain-containing protein [Planctomycetaceae bacterium]
MKRPSHMLPPCAARTRAAFTLVEMLVVIVIIGILAGLTIPAVMYAVGHAKEATIYAQLNQLESACQMYKEKFGEYPPDFTGLDTSIYPAAVVQASQQAILRHLAAAFPQYKPGISTGTPTYDWPGFRLDVLNGWQLDVNNLTPMGALTFFLGGQPDWLADLTGDPSDITLPNGTKVLPAKPVKGFLGFSADPTNPFASAAVSPSRVSPFFDFDLGCLNDFVGGAGLPGGIAVWPSKACNRSKNCAIVYFRAANGSYLCEGSADTVKSCGAVYAAADTRLSQ